MFPARMSGGPIRECLRPGSGGPQFAFGPVALTRESDDGPVVTVPPAKARTLCGKTLDWIESVSRS